MEIRPVTCFEATSMTFAPIAAPKLCPTRSAGPISRTNAASAVTICSAVD